MNETHNIKIGNRVFQIEAICRSEYFSGEDPKHLMGKNSVLHVYMTDGKEFSVFNETADLLWDILCSTALVLQ